MRNLIYSLCLFGLALGGRVIAQERGELDELKRELQELRRRAEKIEQKIDQIESRSAPTARPPGTLAPPVSPPPDAPAAMTPPVDARTWAPADPIRLLGGQRSYLNLSFDGLFSAGTSTADDIDALQPGGHDPKQRGFTVQNLEATFEGMIDPYFRGQANIIYQIDADGESLLEVEEAYLETLSLPGRFQVKGGQYFTEFGRLNQFHPHAWDFVDQPLVNGRFLGGDGLRNPGARVSWLAPTPFYSELYLSVQNSHGETATSFRSAGDGHGGEEEEGLPLGFRHPDNDRGIRSVTDLLFAPRWVSSFDLTDSQTVVFGVSGAFGPNASGQEGGTRTEIYSADLYWKWKSPHHNKGFPFVSFQTEGMLRRYGAGAFDWDEEGNLGDADGNGFPDEGVLVDATGATPAMLGRETLTDYGFYSQLLYGFKPRWVAGLRFDYVTGQGGDYEQAGLLLADNAGGGEAVGRDPARDRRWRLSPNLTWFPTEFSKIRLQYNYDDRRDFGTDHSVWLQFEFLLGSHGAHKF